MLITIIVLPLLIVKGFQVAPEVIKPSGVEKDINIRLFIKAENIIKEIPIEEYVKGVVAAEMPAEFEPEALKAQAVAARTYAYSRYKKLYITDDHAHDDADVCTDYAHCQAWVSKQEAMDRWGSETAEGYWGKIEKAVDDTKGIIITYDNSIINPVFHSNSGGRTENSEDVWSGSAVPYLKSVVSEGEDASSEYKSEVLLTDKEFYDKLKGQYPDIQLNEKDVLKDTKIIDYTEGTRVKDIKVGNITIKGTDFRTLFGLKSALFNVERDAGGKVKITVTGNGHGVGMSQWGANYMAKKGSSYEDIIEYYYTGVALSAIGK